MGGGHLVAVAAQLQAVFSRCARTDQSPSQPRLQRDLLIAAVVNHSGQRSRPMTKIDAHTPEEMPRGSFSDGKASPDRYPDDRQVRSFAEGEADPARYAADERVGTFARGSARPAAYPADLY